jgi:soluble lytic murein transglycosylase-like protein
MATRYRKEIADAAAQFQLDPLLVEAIVLTESSGNTDAFRFEPNFYNRYIKPYKLYAGQNPRRVSSSYGLMQIMLPVAHERGFDKANPPEYLFIPAIGLEFGCKHLRFLLDWAAEFGPLTAVSDQQKLEAAIASYNGGRGGNKPTDQPLRNASYVRKVLANLQTLKTGAA